MAEVEDEVGWLFAGGLESGAAGAVDVFAFGVLVLEVVAGCRPIEPSERGSATQLGSWRRWWTPVQRRV